MVWLILITSKYIHRNLIDLLKNGYLILKGRLEDGTVVAVKVLSVESKPGETEFMSEVASMANINICHENLVKLHGGCIDGPSRILVYDYMQNGSLSQTFLGTI